MFSVYIRRAPAVVRCLMAIYAAAIASNCSEAEENRGTFSPAVWELRAALLNTEAGPQKGAAAQRLLEGLTPREVQNLCFDDDPGVAILAAWHRLELQMDARFVGTDRGAGIIRIPSRLSREFLGFVEGRLIVPPPDGWMACVKTGQYSAWRVQIFEAGAAERIVDVESEARTSYPSVTLSLDERDGKPDAYFVGEDPYEGTNERVLLPDEVVTQLKAERETRSLVVTGLATDRWGALAIQPGVTTTGEVICLQNNDEGDAKVLWRTKMDTAWIPQALNRVTEFRYRDGALFLFHCSDVSVGIEALNVDDGSRIFSFNSCRKVW